MRSALSMLLLGLLCGCATPQPRPSLPEIALQPRAVPQAVSLMQRLQLSRLDGRDSPAQPLDALLEIDPQGLHLAGFALQQRILTLHWDGQKLESWRHPLLPDSVDAGKILRDIELVYWPVAAIQASLPAGWQLEEADGERHLSLGGEIQLLIRYHVDAAGQGQIELENRREGYRLQIESSPQTDSAS